MRVIAIWHHSISDVVSFSHTYGFASHLVSVVSDTEMRGALWGLYRMTEGELAALRKTAPRLTIKD